jgi:methylthioribose-1-phosphate isomerase
MRSPDEVTSFGKSTVAPEGTKAVNYAFDVTPASNVTAIVTENGVFTPPYREKLSPGR